MVSDNTRLFVKFSSKKSMFSLCNPDKQRAGTMCTIIKEVRIRTISAKFGKIQPVVF